MSQRDTVLKILESEDGPMSTVQIKAKMAEIGENVPTSTVRGRLWDLKADGLAQRIPGLDRQHTLWQKVVNHGNRQRVTIQ